MTKRPANRGFSLIEVLIALAIVAILAAIAAPLYFTFSARAQGSEALVLGSDLEPDVVEYYSEHQQWPPGNPANDLVGAASPASIRGTYVTAVAVRNGKIMAQFGNRAEQALRGQFLVLSPNTHGGAVEWTCSVSDRAIYAMVPRSCRHGG